MLSAEAFWHPKQGVSVASRASGNTLTLEGGDKREGVSRGDILEVGAAVLEVNAEGLALR